MNKTKIQWTQSNDGSPGFTSNPIAFEDGEGRRVWGCVKVSAGCTHCYAEGLAHRYGKGAPFTVGSMAGKLVVLDEAELGRIVSSKAISGKRVFLGDMTDVFGEWVPDWMLDRVFAAMALRPDVTFQVLTKRPERMRAYLADLEVRERWAASVVAYGPKTWERGLAIIGWSGGAHGGVDRLLQLPLPNVWLGTSVEDQAAADRRIPELLATPAAVRFLSCEPLLGPVDLTRLDATSETDPGFSALVCTEDYEGTLGDAVIDRVIVGGESGAGARPCNWSWIRGIVRQCQAAGVPVFVKQGGAYPYSLTNPDGTANDGVVGRHTITKLIRAGDIGRLRDRAGGDPEEWPEDLRVREWPASGAIVSVVGSQP